MSRLFSSERNNLSHDARPRDEITPEKISEQRAAGKIHLKVAQ